jgi:hypothetical protein
MVSFECLATLLRQGVEGRLDDVVLVEVGSIVAGVPPFMLDVREAVDSPAKSPKVCWHTNRTGTGSPCLKQGKLNYLVWQIRPSGFFETDGS